MRILALETSCDDTCAAVVDRGEVRSNVISSQAAAHERFGGIVPEVASRHHLELVNAVVDAALAEADCDLEGVDELAVTRGPGLIGALLVGVSTAKALAAAVRKPLVGVNHLHGHVAANYLEPDPLEPPFLCLIASGGHTLLAGVREREGFEVLGETLDDAAGEALDKGARLLGLGYPGGPEIERLAAGGDPEAFELPRGMSRDPGLDFSFSGVKTALLYVSVVPSAVPPPPPASSSSSPQATMPRANTPKRQLRTAIHRTRKTFPPRELLRLWRIVVRIGDRVQCPFPGQVASPHEDRSAHGGR